MSGEQWKRPSQCADAACVEVKIGRESAGEPDYIWVRHSRETAYLLFSPPEWRAFIAAAKAGEFDVD